MPTPRIDPEELELDDLRPCNFSIDDVENAVERFRDASLRGDYYEAFSNDSKSSTQMSDRATVWIAECNRLLECCGAAVIQGYHSVAQESFEILFDLLKHIDAGDIDIVFFADDAGSRRVGVDWDDMLPRYFESLSITAKPSVFAEAVVDSTDAFGGSNGESFLREALGFGTSAQKQALRDLLRHK